MIDSIWTPPGWSICTKNGKIRFYLADCNATILGGKDKGFYVFSHDKLKHFPKFHYNWENWEIFANFCSRNILNWFSDSWQNFEWNFGATHISVFRESDFLTKSKIGQIKLNCGKMINSSKKLMIDYKTS